MTNKSILLVDDCLPNLKLTRFLLKQGGFEVGTAESAEQALLALEARVPDMILMDISRASRDGWARADAASAARRVALRDADCGFHGVGDQGR